MKKLIALLLVAAAALCLCSCGKKEEPKTLLDDIIETGVLNVSLSPDFAPMEFVDPDKQGQDQYAGFDVELAKYIAAALSEEYGKTITVNIEAMDFNSCQVAVAQKTVHMSISGYSVTAERQENYLLSDFYYAGENESEQWVIALADKAATLNAAADFKGVSVAAQNASLQLNMLNAQLTEATPVIIDSLDTAILELVNGKIDALCVSQGQGMVFMSQYSEIAKCGFQFEVSEDEEANVILLAQGEEALLAKVNEILAKAYAEGVYGDWYTDSVAYATELGQL